MYVRRKAFWKVLFDLAKKVIGEVDFEGKGEVFGISWKARVVIEPALGSCLIAVVMAIGRRRTNAILLISG